MKVVIGARAFVRLLKGKADFLDAGLFASVQSSSNRSWLFIWIEMKRIEYEF